MYVGEHYHSPDFFTAVFFQISRHMKILSLKTKLK